MAYQGRYHNNDSGGKARGGAWKIVLIVVLCVVLLLGLLFGAAYFYLDSKLNKINKATFEEKDVSGQDLSALIGNLDESNPTINISETVPTEAPTEAPTEPDYGETGKIVNILLIGQDGREGEEAKLADGIMLFTLNKETRTLTTTSFLRDSYVKLADYRGKTCGWNRINTSYALGYSWFGNAGAMEMLNLTLENNYGVKVDGNVEVDFSAVVKIVDAMGGLDIELTGAEFTRMQEYRDIFNTQYENLGISWYRTIDELHEGVNRLNGDMVLAYARERHLDNADSDIKRTARQRKVINAILERLVSLSPKKLNKVIDTALSLVTTDMTTDEMKTYILELTPYLFDLKLVSNQCPAEGTYWGEMVELPDGLSGVLKIDFEANKRILQAVMNGEEIENTTIQ